MKVALYAVLLFCSFISLFFFHLLQALRDVPDVCAEPLVSASRVLPASPGDQMGQWLPGCGFAGAPSAPRCGPTRGIKPPDAAIIERGSQGRRIAS